MKKQSKPWENKAREDLTPEEIRLHCKSDLEAWDEFLNDDVEVPRKESLLEEDGLTITKFAAGYNDLVEEAKPEDKNQREIAFVRDLLACLTIRQREVIQAHYWDELSEREIATKFKISRGAVRNYRDKALKKMGVITMSKMLAFKAIRELAN